MDHMKTPVRAKIRIISLVVLDIFCVFFSLLLAVALHGNIPDALPRLFGKEFYYCVGNLLLTVFLYTLLRLYQLPLSTFGILEMMRLYGACALLAVCNLLYSLLMPGTVVDWRFALLFTGMLLLLTGSYRSLKRFLILARQALRVQRHHGKRTMLVGAGNAGALLLREMQTSPELLLHPVCFIDDDPSLYHSFIGNVRVVGKTEDIPYYARRYRIRNIVIAMPSAEKADIKRIHEICSTTRCKIQILPGVYQLVTGQVSVSALRDVSVQDLLGREQTKTNLDQIMGYIEGRVVMVTGGGGSIGSELCRQIATHHPRRLIILDIYENNAYDIQQELIRRHPELDLMVLIASVRDAAKIDHIFDTFRPEIVFHAAAHKHVPLMETSPSEAIKNNVFGTLNTARAADRYGTRRFVMISTDKAVNPTNVMGATKRICEMIIQTMGRHSKTEFVAVRFGNVLGSNGSVIPLFRQQIAEGGPVTLTHKDIIRYFMTIPEAVSLVLQAGAYARGGEIFVLDMGEPVRIYDLAYNLIKLSGYEPDVDIKIEITGLRPGEKLYEERLMAEEGMQKTANDSISIGRPLEIDEDHLFACLEKLRVAAAEDSPDLRALIQELVPTYHYET